MPEIVKDPTLQVNSIKHKIAKKKIRIQTPLINKGAWKGVRKDNYKAIKFQNTPSDNDSGSYEINLPYYGGGSPEERLV